MIETAKRIRVETLESCTVAACLLRPTSIPPKLLIWFTVESLDPVADTVFLFVCVTISLRPLFPFLDINKRR